MFSNVAVFNKPGIYSFICPSTWDKNNFKIECLGGGQAGLSCVSSWIVGGAGGAGGYYSFFDQTGVFQDNAPKPGDTLIITVADYAQPQLQSDNLIVGGWKRGNTSTVFLTRKNEIICQAIGGQTNPLPAPVFPNINFGNNSIVGGAGGLADTANAGEAGTDAGFLGGDGAGGGAPGIFDPVLGAKPTGGLGANNEFGKGADPTVPYGLPGPGGASYYPPPNEPTGPSNDINLRNAIVTRILNGVFGPGFGFTISQGSNGGSTGFNGSNVDDISKLTDGFPGLENPILAWTDTFNGANAGLGGGGAGGRGWMFMTDPAGNVPTPASGPHSKDKVFLFANMSGSLQPFSSYYGYNGGDGGRGAGGGGAGIGSTVNQEETGIGGRGGLGLVVISWGNTNPPLSLQPNLIPLPKPHYAMTPRGLFYPWGFKK